MIIEHGPWQKDVQENSSFAIHAASGLIQESQNEIPVKEAKVQDEFTEQMRENSRNRTERTGEL